MEVAASLWCCALWRDLRQGIESPLGQHCLQQPPGKLQRLLWLAATCLLQGGCLPASGGRRAALATRRPVVVCAPAGPPLGTPDMQVCQQAACSS